MSLTIRKTHADDSALILQFIQEMADYEQLSHQMVATEEDIRRGMFGHIPRAFCIIAEWEGKPAGMAIYFYNYSTFLGKDGIYIEDIWVSPDMRGHGVGKALLSHLATKAVKEGCARMEWWVLDRNKESIEFYESLNAKPMDEWVVYRLSGSTLERLAET